MFVFKLLKRFFAGSLVLSLFVAALPAYANSISLSIPSISPSAQVTVGTVVTFSIQTSGFMQPSYSIRDSLANTSISNSDINYDGSFSWTPTANDIGDHELIISVTDLAGDSSASISENISVAAVGSVLIQSISPGSSVVAGAPMGFTVEANGFTDPIYSITDSFPGSSVTTDDISQNGYFTWTPKASDKGTHVITVRVNDYYGHVGSVQQQIIVGTAASAPVSTPINNTPANTPVSSAAFTSSLSVGSSGTQVSELQQRLFADGFYSGPVTGYFGALTEAAVEKYQTAHNVNAVGSVGPMTRALLNEGL